MIKVIIFDLNGVFIQSPKLSDRFEQDFGIASEKFLPALKEIMSQVRQPNAGECYDYWSKYLREWGVDLDQNQFYNYWFSAEEEVPELIELAKELKDKEFKLFILSNNFVERANYYAEHFSFLKEIFEKVYYSFITGFVKPDVRAYQNLLKGNYLKGEECLYFDDSEDNIEVAKSLGINAHTFKSVDELKQTLSSL